jgi:glycosyltransferase involved in cell wall biosynthesis
MSSPAPIRVMMTSDAVGGVWTYAAELASALAATEADVHLVTMGPPPQDEKRAMLRDRRVRLIESSLALEWQDPAGENFDNARQFLEDLEDTIEPDIVHLNSFREANFDWLAPVVVVAHSCCNSWGAACNDKEWLSEPRWQHYTRAVSSGLNKANAWISPSQAHYDAICDLYWPNSPGTVILNGVSPARRPTHQRSRFILAAGRMWDSSKNLVTLARASTGLEWPILVAGPTSDPAATGELTVLGDLSHSALLSRMQHAAIFVSPALYEPFGLSVLEAASAGCALVLSDIPTFRELWNEAAMFIDPEDDRALHDALAALCRDDGNRARLQLAARERSQRYSLTRTVDAYRTLYRRLQAQHPRSLPGQAPEVHA